MGTNASITVKTGKEEYKSIYLHWDGYPSHALKVLREHYNTFEKAMELIKLGNLSALYKNLAPEEGQEHSFEKPADDVTIAYGRDRGETDQQATTSYRWVEDMGYNYIFSGGRWDTVEHEDNCADINPIVE